MLRAQPEDYGNAQAGCESDHSDAREFLRHMQWKRIGSTQVQLDQGLTIEALVYSKRIV